MPKHRWSRGSNPGEKLHFADLYEHHLKKNVRACFLNYPQGYAAFIASGDGDIKEIVFVKDGTAYKRSENSKAGASRMADVALLASHQSFAIVRAIRKMDSILTDSIYGSVMAPFDVISCIKRDLKKPKDPNNKL